MTQKELIIKYMEDFGSITTIEAFTDLGITKLTSRISELRKDGFIIASKKIDKKSRYGKPVKFNRYWLEAEA